MCYSHLEKHCHSSVTMCMCVCVCVCVHVACVRAGVCVHVMYVTTTTHKYNYLKNVTIGFLMFQFRQCHVRVFVPQIVIVTRLQQGSSLCNMLLRGMKVLR